MDPQAQLWCAAIVVGVLWLAFGGSRRPKAARAVVGRRNKRRFYSWWPWAAVAIALMWALDVFDDGFELVSSPDQTEQHP